ncbi:unnamed protein product [Ectocarpus sp. CCAP 1310/34]|nr:unnamed protein product [Ectocarpus sp. CCAP 1310/34]
MAARAPSDVSSVQAGAAAAPTTPERLEEVETLLAYKKPWPAFLCAGVDVHGEWDNCPEGARDALEWMASTAVGLLDIASVGPLTPVCKAFTALIEAAQGAMEVVKNLRELVTWCAFLVGVLIEHGKQVENLKAVNKPLNEFVATTGELAKRANVVAGRGKMEERSRPLPLPDMADVPAAALKLPPSHVKRVGLEAEILKSLTTTDASGAPYVLLGVGGAGKSLLASSVVRTEEVRKHFRAGAFWLRVGPGGEDQLFALCDILARKVTPATKLPQQFNSLEDIIQHLTVVVAEDRLPRLMVLDDVLERAVVDTLRPTGLRLLVTTRLDSLVAVRGGRTVVGNMDRAEARELLKSKSGAIELPETEADQTKTILGPQMDADIGDNPTKESLFHVLDLSLKYLGRHQHRLFLSLVVLARGVSAPAPMLASIWDMVGLCVIKCATSLEKVDNMGARNEADFFVSNSLLQEVDGSFRVHDLLLDFARTRCEKEILDEAVKRQSQYLRRLAVLQDYRAKGDPLEGLYSLIVLWRKLAEHCGNEQVEVEAYHASLGELGDDESAGAADAFSAVGRLLGLETHLYVSFQGKLDEAGPLYDRAIRIWEAALGPEHSQVATALNNRARLLRVQGKYDDAEQPYERSLAIREKGNYDEAGKLYERSLAIREKALGPDHPDVAQSLNNWAGLLGKQVRAIRKFQEVSCGTR